MDEKAEILAALQRTGRNVTKAARLLGSSRRTLQKRMRLYGIPVGRAGRRKRPLPYGKRARGAALAVGAAAAVGAVLLIRGRSGTST